MVAVGNATDFEAALFSKNPEALKQAWLFLERIEESRSNQDTAFKRKLAGKKLQVLKVVLEIHDGNGKVAFFGNRNKVVRDITHYQEESVNEQA